MLIMSHEKIENPSMQLVKEFEKVCIDLATGKREVPYSEYESARNNLISDLNLQPIIPKWIIEKRYGSQFWQFMKKTSENYQGRRDFIWASVAEMEQYLENGSHEPIAISFGEIDKSIKSSNIEDVWKKIHKRRVSDPEGTITASRTMLESTLKHTLDKLGDKYSSKDDLPNLYKKVSQRLSLSPANHHEQIFKQILQGITSVVIGFSSLRNEYGDAHGKGKTYVQPQKRHADLVVNLSGALCVFLLETLKVHTTSNK